MRKKQKRSRAVLTAALLVAGAAGVLLTGCKTTERKEDSAVESSVRENAEPEVREVLIGDNGVQERENWDRFVKDSGGKKEARIRLRYQYSDTAADKLSFMPESTEAYLSYDGENYWYNDGGKNTAYRYLLKLSGRNPNAEKSTTMWILANEKYTFDQISKSWYSNDSGDHISYELIYSV